MYEAEELRTAQNTTLHAIEEHLDRITTGGRRIESTSEERNQLEELKSEAGALFSGHKQYVETLKESIRRLEDLKDVQSSGTPSFAQNPLIDTIRELQETEDKQIREIEIETTRIHRELDRLDQHLQTQDTSQAAELKSELEELRNTLRKSKNHLQQFVERVNQTRHDIRETTEAYARPQRKNTHPIFPLDTPHPINVSTPANLEHERKFSTQVRETNPSIMNPQIDQVSMTALLANKVDITSLPKFGEGSS